MKETLEQAIERVKQLPADQQQLVAVMLNSYADQDRTVQLNEQQIAEIRTRLADPNAKFSTHEDVTAAFLTRFRSA